MDTKAALGRYIRQLREQANLTQDRLARKTGISYQYLSSLENGRENFSIDVLAALAKSLDAPVQQLVAGAFAERDVAPIPTANEGYFRPNVPLPPGLKVPHLEAAMNESQRIFALINSNLRAHGRRPLFDYIQGNNFSGLISNILCDAINEHSPYKHNSHQAYPDLINPKVLTRGKPEGLEVKSTIQIGKGGESHNGRSGWHLVACYRIDRESCHVKFVHIMVAVLNGHTHPRPDWKYVGSKVNAVTGSRRTETYNTTLVGTTKLRDGSVYLDPTVVNFKRWRARRIGGKPPHAL
ncbi:MAG: helix-turn-helix transcriptional regulator [Verrucomicrobiota bacterium]|nr:helix-turn-helix transcriptional regulator [Verrucomicrobiota bacterium]